MLGFTTQALHLPALPVKAGICRHQDCLQLQEGLKEAQLEITNAFYKALPKPVGFQVATAKLHFSFRGGCSPHRDTTPDDRLLGVALI